MPVLFIESPTFIRFPSVSPVNVPVVPKSILSFFKSISPSTNCNVSLTIMFLSITIVRGHQRQQGTGSFTANYGIARYFDIPGIGEIDSSNVNIKLKYWDAELSGHTEANLVQYQSVTQSSNTWWTPLTGTVDTIVNLYTPASHPYTSYIYGSAYSYVYFSNRFTLGSTDIPLPIELLSFDAKLKNDIVELTWTTASEINNDYFTVEKTRYGKTFEQVAIIKGAGTSNEVINYFAIDENPYQYISYYRLKQTDFDGKYKYSDLVSINNPHKYNYNNNGLIVYPNPSKSKNFYIKINEQVINEKILINIYDIFGKKCYSETIFFDKNNIIEIRPNKELHPGIYLISAYGKNYYSAARLIIE